MRYLLLIHASEEEENAMSPEALGEMLAGYGALGAELEKAGAILGGARLRPVGDATTVRVRNGDITTTDGPFAETKEQLGGYFLVEAADLDEAIAWAAKVPSASMGSVEVRPVWEMEE